MRRLLAITGGLLVWGSCTAWAATFDVSTPAAFQTALTTAQANGKSDTINVAAGTYTISSTLAYSTDQDYALTIIGAGSSSTILDGGDARQVMSLACNGAGDISLSGMTFQNGRAGTADNPLGGGFMIIQNAEGSVTVDACVMSGNSVYRSGGGAYIALRNGDVSVTHCQATNNTCDPDTGVAGAGLYIYYGNDSTADVTAVVSNCVFRNNVIGDHPNSPGGCYGAGLMVYHVGTESVRPVYRIENNTIDENTSHFGSGGAFIKNAGHNALVTITDNTFSNNVSGGGVEDPPPEIQGSGLHLYTYGGTTILNHNQFLNNRLRGVYEDGGGLGAFICNDYAGTFEMNGNVFAGNSTAMRNGGGAVINLFANVTEATIVNNLFVNNTANTEGGTAGGLSLNAECSVNMVNNTFYGNSASDAGGFSFYSDTGSGALNLYNEINWGNTPNALANYGTGSLAARYSDIQGGTGESWFGEGCIDINPAFYNTSSPEGADGIYATLDDGLHLTTGSPAGNQGNNAYVPASITTDIAAQPRIQNVTVDMGAYEGVAGTPNCLPVAADLSIPIPCVQYLGNAYGLTLGFYSNPGDPGGFYWTLVPGTFKAGEGEYCLYVASDLSIPIPCASYNGTQFGFTLGFYPNPYDPSGLYWKMDLSTLDVK